MIRLFALSALLVFSALGWAEKTGTSGLPDDEAARCRYGAEQMIALAKESLAELRTRPEGIEKRKKLVDDWTSRLEKGEDPCSVYRDIQKVATTF